MKNKKIIISGGGTGGHIFPAISIANAIMEMENNTEILFVGAKGKIEMEKVPTAGYKIKGLPIRGIERKFTFSNIIVLFNLFISIIKSYLIIKKFKPDAVIGVGGYASAPVVYVASLLKIPTLLQEQNSFAGVTNKLLSKKAKKICVAYDNMDKFFSVEKIVKTGNPVREILYKSEINKKEAYKYFDINENKKTVLILGGSGGAKSINEAVINKLDLIKDSNFQFIWQTGKYYYDISKKAIENKDINNLKIFDFINKMEYAYSVTDLVISRAGAGTISELCIVSKASILVPSPNVADDHQTKNAIALLNNNAAILIKDEDAFENLIPKAIELIKDEELIEKLNANISKMAIKDSDKLIAKEIFNLLT
ncbi:MAG: undecaprenyldiphospho-muramoylpentapeptide beta-N-acetylglucosaminyltransferase [Bacteroidales bacterium]|nr:undecaprenyldiphospho-muramoylpentapeptide beta-N-acetylglucosaminyltransferase [Bacteroidales bacterium]MBN2756850.1 undecaprenyldiphospho-muramoylpentapeptide beta-N-acetylglucosaminyltransferase [Bacteroidales bacterium]